tara:strand:- start:1231 stop:1761 length:531 start_codon:yes stop_codon:yes gene_type:complete
LGAKTVPLSVRLSGEDAAYIASLKAGDAITMSEKVRFLVARARLTAEQGESYEGVVEQAEDTLAPLKHVLDSVETEYGARSSLLRALIFSLPRMLAELETAYLEQSIGKAQKYDVEKLTALEAKAANSVKNLLDQLARLSVTEEAPCLDPAIMRKFLAGPVVELVRLIEQNPNFGE